MHTFSAEQLPEIFPKKAIVKLHLSSNQDVFPAVIYMLDKRGSKSRKFSEEKLSPAVRWHERGNEDNFLQRNGIRIFLGLFNVATNTKAIKATPACIIVFR